MYSRGGDWQLFSACPALFSFFFSCCDYVRLLHAPSSDPAGFFFRRCLPPLHLPRPARESDRGGPVWEKERITGHHFAQFRRDSFRDCFTWRRRDVFCDHRPRLYCTVFPLSIGKSFPLLAWFVFSADSVPARGAIVFRAQLILFLFCCVTCSLLYSPNRSARHPARLAKTKNPTHPDNDTKHAPHTQ